MLIYAKPILYHYSFFLKNSKKNPRSILAPFFLNGGEKKKFYNFWSGLNSIHEGENA